MLNPTVSVDSLIPIFGTVRRDLEQAFEEAGFNGNRRQVAQCPLSMWEDEDRFYIAADLPGLSNDELSVEFEDGKLWIRGERKIAEDHPRFTHNERRFGKFERAVVLSEFADPSSIEAEFDRGVLTIWLAKKPESQPRKITIRSGSDSPKTVSAEVPAE